jgi:hypothetical protein
MKRITILFFFLIASNYSFAQSFSISATAGIDNYTIPSVDQNFNLYDGSLSFLIRDEVANPANFGIQFRLKNNKFTYGFDGNMTYKEYNVRYGNLEDITMPPFPGSLDTIYVKNYTVPWVRAELNLFILYDIFTSHGFTISGGVGGGMQIVSPVVSDSFIEATLLTKLEHLDVSTDVSPEYLGNGKIIAELRYNISEHLSAGVDADYLFLQKGKFDQPASFAVIKGFVAFGL